MQNVKHFIRIVEKMAQIPFEQRLIIKYFTK